MAKPKEKLDFIFFTIAAVYIFLTFLAPLNPDRFDLSTTEIQILRTTLILPIILVWLAAIYGAGRFKDYSKRISQHRDGQAFDKIANGIAVLVGSIILNGLFGTLRPWALRDGWLETFTVLANYLAAFLPIIGFALIYVGSVKLKRTLKKKDNRLANVVFLISLAAVAGLHILTLLNYQYRNTTPDPSIYSSFYLSDWLIVLSLALPHIVAWWLGIKAAMNIRDYQQRVRGVIYKAALFRLAVGTLLVVGFSVILQVLVAFSTFFSRASLGALLLIVYMLILLYAAGFLVIASGAKKLMAIEKVGR